MIASNIRWGNGTGLGWAEVDDEEGKKVSQLDRKATLKPPDIQIGDVSMEKSYGSMNTADERDLRPTWVKWDGRRSQILKDIHFSSQSDCGTFQDVTNIYYRLLILITWYLERNGLVQTRLAALILFHKSCLFPSPRPWCHSLFDPPSSSLINYLRHIMNSREKRGTPAPANENADLYKSLSPAYPDDRTILLDRSKYCLSYFLNRFIYIISTSVHDFGDERVHSLCDS